MSTLQQHRAAMLEACTIAIDAILLSGKNNADYANQEPVVFDAEIFVRFGQGSIGSHPMLDLTQDTRPQLDQRGVRVIDPT